MNELIRLFKNYYIIDIWRLFRDMFICKLFFPSNVRLIRQPAYIVGKRYVKFGSNFRSGPNLRLEVLDSGFIRSKVDTKAETPQLIIGNNVSLNFNVHIGVAGKVEIEDNVLIASNVLIIDHNHGNYSGPKQDSPFSIPHERECVSKNIKIGENSWIGENVSILPGTIIGSGCIIGANSVISGVFKDNQIIVGAPAKAIKGYDEETKKWLSL